ncbi:MAG TPA: M48 family metallopeptidase [Patescibacteria group bacterium]|nr:M48 family metallopeptidase [Patescibacteria group bacterium]
MKNIYEVQSANKIKSAVIVALFVVFTFIAAYILTNAFGYYLGYSPGGFGFFGMALIVSGISSFASYYYSDKIVLGISGAREANKAEDKLFNQVVENLCIGAGLPRPKLYVIDDVSPNAFATGRDPEHAAICATTGLLSKLNRSEMEGVFGHELTHIKNFDTRLMAVVAVMVGLVALLGDWFLRSMWWGGRRNNDDEGEAGAIFLVLGIIFAILSPIIGTLIQLAISRRREFVADAGSVALTRQPQDLIAALTKIASDPMPLKSANKATAHLFIENPFKKEGHGKTGWFSGLFDTHPPTPERIKALQNML